MDYTAFGEDISSGVGLRTASQGFNASTNLRQRYGLTERDEATGLDHTWFRKNENRAGRWTSPDPYNGSASIGNPQSWNRYSYVTNQPTNFVDPSGLRMVAIRVCRTIGYRTAYVDGQYDSTWEIQACETQIVWVQDVGGIDFGGGVSRDDDPCDVRWVLFPNGMREYLGLKRKSGTARNHQFGTLKTVELIRAIGEEWKGISDAKIRAGDISLLNRPLAKLNSNCFSFKVVNA